MSNMDSESRFNPKALNPSSKAYGLVQWLGGRKTNLQNQVYCAGASNCPKYDTAEGQIKFMMYEFNGGESAAYKKLKSASTPREAAYNLCFYYERPGLNNAQKAKECNRRINADLNNNINYVNNGCK